MKYVLLFLMLFSVPISAQEKFSIFFDFNQEVPNRSSIVRFNEWIKNPNIEVVKLSGHADSVDVSNYNKELSLRRINSVLELLKTNHVAISKSVTLDPKGEDFKQSDNQSENRRVEIVYRNLNDLTGSASQQNPTADLSLTEDNMLTEVVKSQLKNARKGDMIRIENINFHLNSEKVVAESEPILFELYQIMSSRPGLRIEIHGHICCNRNTTDTKLSYRRAKYIFTYLLEHGIALNRLGYKGFGSANPIYPIPERNPAEERANRRVELLVTETTLLR